MLAAALFLAPAFYQDVLPIFQKRCLGCHSTGEIAMPLDTFERARPWAKAIREAVLQRRMPPWFADPRYGAFANDPTLTPAELKTIDAWVNGGAEPGPRVRGAPESPPLRRKRDVVLTMPSAFVIPAGAKIDYQYIVIPTGFTEDRWAHGIEVIPGDRRVVHHAVVYVREKGSHWLREAKAGVPYRPSRPEPEERYADILAVYTPGSSTAEFPAGMAKKIPAGSDLILQTHYTSLREETRDRTSIALSLREPPARRVLTLQMGNYSFVIPPGERNHRVAAYGTLPRDALLLSLFPHMHMRGRAFEFDVQDAGGGVETLLRVDPYHFQWQLTYRLGKPRLLRAGTRLIWTAYYDNSSGNPRNPDPSAEVRYGEQSWEEMMIGFFDVAVEPDADKSQFLSPIVGPAAHQPGSRPYGRSRNTLWPRFGSP